jgi:hypothetical protein
MSVVAEVRTYSTLPAMAVALTGMVANAMHVGLIQRIVASTPGSNNPDFEFQGNFLKPALEDWGKSRLQSVMPFPKCVGKSLT